jgi:hypothetical protein
MESATLKMMVIGQFFQKKMKGTNGQDPLMVPQGLSVLAPFELGAK